MDDEKFPGEPGPITVIIRGRTRDGLFKETTVFENEFRKITIPVRKVIELERVEILREGETDMDGVQAGFVPLDSLEDDLDDDHE